MSDAFPVYPVNPLCLPEFHENIPAAQNILNIIVAFKNAAEQLHSAEFSMNY